MEGYQLASENFRTRSRWIHVGLGESLRRLAIMRQHFFGGSVLLAFRDFCITRAESP